MRSVFGVLILLIGIVTLFLDKSIFDFAVNNNFSWTLSKLLSWIIVFITAIVAAFLLNKNMSSHKWRVSTLIGIPIILLSLMFAVNPIYTGDYVKQGTAFSIQDNELLDIIEDHKENFNGLVAVVDYNCPFCKMATKNRLNLLEERDNKIDLVLTLNTADETTIEKYRNETNSHNLDYIAHSPTKDLIELTKGVFPTFVYIKNGMVLHKWKNSELGFPAMDWIEAGLE